MSERPQNKHLKPCKPGETHNPNGRPKKQITKIAEITQRDYGVKLTKADIYQMIQHCLEMDLAKLNKIVRDETEPVFMLCIAKAIINDIKKGNITTVESIFDRIFGKPSQAMRHSSDPENPILDLVGLRQLIDDESKQT